MTTLIDRYRVASMTDPPIGLLTFVTRTAAESYRENLKGITRSPTVLQERLPDGSWVNLEEVRP